MMQTISEIAMAIVESRRVKRRRRPENRRWQIVLLVVALGAIFGLAVLSRY